MTQRQRQAPTCARVWGVRGEYPEARGKPRTSAILVETWLPPGTAEDPGVERDPGTSSPLFGCTRQNPPPRHLWTRHHSPETWPLRTVLADQEVPRGCRELAASGLLQDPLPLPFSETRPLLQPPALGSLKRSRPQGFTFWSTTPSFIRRTRKKRAFFREVPLRAENFAFRKSDAF